MKKVPRIKNVCRCGICNATRITTLKLRQPSRVSNYLEFYNGAMAAIIGARIITPVNYAKPEEDGN